MDITFKELFDSFKKLNESEKKEAIINFLNTNNELLQDINKEINDYIDLTQINLITKEPTLDDLDVIYKLIHVMVKQVEIFADKVATDYYD